MSVIPVPFMRVTLKNILTKNGYEIAGEASNGKESVDLYQKTQPDLVTMDITMPEMNGFEVCQHLKSDPKLMAIPVVFLSALSDAERTELVAHLRARHFSRDEVVFHRDDAGGHFYVILSGSVKVAIPDEEGHEVVVHLEGVDVGLVSPPPEGVPHQARRVADGVSAVQRGHPLINAHRALALASPRAPASAGP